MEVATTRIHEIWSRCLVSEGDQVLFGKYSGTEVTFDDEELIILREDDVIARITEMP